MRRFLILCILLVVIVGAGFVVMGQDDDPFAVCEADGRAGISDALDAASAVIRDGPDEDLQTALLAAQLILETYRSRCELGLIWTSENTEDGVTDAIQLPDGVFTVTLEADGPVTIDITTLDGRCGDTYIFIPSDGGEEQSVSQIEGCLMVMDVDSGGFNNDDVVWSLIYEPIAVP